MRLPQQLLVREKDVHKGGCGRVLVVGGSPGLTGAVCLCAQASIRIGAGLVRAAVPRSLNTIFEVKLTEVMTFPLADIGGCLSGKDFNKIEKSLEAIDVLAVGPGIGMHPATKKLIERIIKKVDKLLILDADALNILALEPGILNERKSREVILTPHLGEFSRLTKKNIAEIKESRKELAKSFALRYNLHLVLKGPNTLVTDGKDFFDNTTGNPGMATAGTGDVLSGLIAGVAAQGVVPFLAAKTGVYLHGLSGDLAAKDKTENCLIASDLLDYLPEAIKIATGCRERG